MTAPAEQNSKPSTQRLITPSRIILFALLIVAVIGLVIDQTARKNAADAFAKLERAMGPERKLTEVTRTDVHKLLGRDPDADRDPKDLYETYTWQGAIFPQKVFVQYRTGTDGILKDISQNTPPEGYPD